MKSVKQLLEEARVIAVVGCSDRPTRESYGIARFLIDRGYTIYPVNPTISSALGLRAYPDLAGVPEPIDIVNVFRNPIYAVEVARESIAAEAEALWFQLGAGNPEAERIAAEAGLTVVSERCIAVEHRLNRIGD